MKKKVIAVFDIGKTNKKILCFDENLDVVYQEESKFPEIKDDDGFECDDIDALESFVSTTLAELVAGGKYEVAAVNFSTYGATLMYLDDKGKRLTPIYNYLKPMPAGIVEPLYDRYGGVEEFSRKTASPALGMLNSGLQALWLKNKKPEVFQQVKSILHFPQYLSYLLTGKITSESTSIGCHTAMWDFDHMTYHPWLAEEGIQLPQPVDNSITFEAEIDGKKVNVGIGIHDSSASLAPYLKGSNEKFILISTGTWGINMNPFNNEPLTADQLEKDSLCFLSINQEQVKSSRLFMGYIHEVNTDRLTKYFGVPEKTFATLKANEEYVVANWHKKVFFKDGVPENSIDETVDYSQFGSFEEAYHQLVIDLTRLTIDSLKLIIPEKDDSRYFYISGGFARNEIFVRLIATYFPEKIVYTSEIDNASALGAALVVYDKFGKAEQPELDLGLKEWKAFSI